MNTMARHIQHHTNMKFLEDLPISIPRYVYNGKDQFHDIMSLELERFEMSTSRVNTTSACLPGHSHQRQSLHSMHLRHAPQHQDCSSFNLNSNLPHQPSPSPYQRSYPLQDIDDSTNEYALFEISERHLRTDFLDKVISTNLSLRLSFDLTTNLLLVKMMGPIHTEVLSRFHEMIFLALTNMGLRSEFHNYTGTTIRGNGSGKEADSGWGPSSTEPEYTGKPTITLEVAVSESQAKFERDVGWWLSPTKGGANMTLTVKVDRRAPVLTVDKWQWVDGEIERTQQITMEKVNGSVVFSGDPLVIPFNLLFLREPRDGTAEGDIVISRGEFGLFADPVWRIQGFRWFSVLVFCSSIDSSRDPILPSILQREKALVMTLI